MGMVLLAVTAVVFLAALLFGSSLLWFYRGPILTHLGKLGMTLLVLGLASVLGFFGAIVFVQVLSMNNPKGPFALTLTVDEDGVTPREYRNVSLPKGERAVLLVSSDRKVEVRFGDKSRVVRPGSPPEAERESSSLHSMTNASSSSMPVPTSAWTP